MTERKLPVQQLTILAICRFAEPISLTSIFPYLPEMIESLGVPKPDIAKWAGITSAVFSLSQCLTAIIWGRASDRFGRKPVILLGFINAMFTSLLFGFSTTLAMALVARALAGAGSGTVGIIRTMVAELVPFKELQPRAFSVMPLVYTVGSVIGPALGGALANPLRRPPEALERDGFLEKFPYALPNIVAAVAFLVGITTGVLFLQETLQTRKHRRDYGLMLGAKIKRAVVRQVGKVKRWGYPGTQDEVSPLLKPTPVSSFSMPSDEECTTGLTAERQQDEPPPSFRKVLTPQSTLNLLVYTLLALHSLAYDTLLPVFMHHPHTPSTSGNPLVSPSGLALPTPRIGLIFTLYGASTLLFQFALFPPLARHYGVLRCFRLCSLAYPGIYLATPFAALLPTSLSRQAALVAIILAKGLVVTVAFPSSTILLTNSASGLRVLGTLNGIATSASAVGRAAGPAIAGAAFTWGVKRGCVGAPFWVLAGLAAGAAVPSFWLVEGRGFGGEAKDEAEEEAEDEEEGVQGAERVGGGERGEGRWRAETERDGLDEPRRSAEVREGARGCAGDADEACVVESEDDEMGLGEGEGSRRRTLSRRGSMAGQRGRRRSSAPIGMGRGFRRMSSNLGQSMSGWGTGAGGSLGT